MKISITSGRAEGPTELNAFDNALLDAGIGNINLIKVSSIIPPNAQIVEVPEFKAGEMVNCVLAQVTSNKVGDKISALVAVALSDDLGCVVEHSAVNKHPKQLVREARAMVKHMMEIRERTINKIIVEQENHTVQNWGAVVAAVVYLG
jgi:arginine decarboxylase